LPDSLSRERIRNVPGAADDCEPVERIERSDSEWRLMLTPEQYEVLRGGATEVPFSTDLDDVEQTGTYVCAGCRAELFDSEARYESESGWPAFLAPIIDEALTEEGDTCDGAPGIEVRCARCNGHLGHVFSDGPGPDGLRYCINTAALELEER
jgi:peptide-methionine (R)-S-oxide reductase